MSATESQGKISEWAVRAQPWLLLVLGLIYWGLYLQYWFNPHDEGGTAALTAMRILEGQRPIRDVDLGYNVLWHYPIVALFSITGVSYVKMRAYFFALSAVTALCGWAVVRKVTGRSWLAFALGAILVVFPGSQFKNYIPLLAMVNTLWLLRTFGHQPPASRRFLPDTLVGGVILGLSFLVRIDISYFFSLLWAGLLVVQLADTRYRPGLRFARLGAGVLTLAGAVLLCHWPVYAVARAQGFEREFVGQYRSSANMIREFAQNRLQSVVSAGKPLAVPPAAASSEASATAAPPANARANRNVLQRKGLAQFWAGESGSKSVLFLLTYAPFVGVLVFLGYILATGWRSLRTCRFSMGDPSIQLLTVLGGALTIFPQFFFFRPDRPHLSEFMVGFLVAMVCGGWLVWDATWRAGTWQRWAGIAVLAFLSTQAALYGWLALDHPSAGTIAARSKRTIFFKAQNGVAVYLSRKESETMRGVYEAITRASKPGEYVVCYPYQPGYNLMADRPTYERSVYIDNSTAPKNWAKTSIEAIQNKKPAVIVIDDRAINGSEDSRFSRWAPETYAFIQKNYHLVGKFALSEVYSREAAPGSLPAIPSSL